MCNQPHMRMETAVRIAMLKFRKVRKAATNSGSSSNSGTWINMGHGFGYQPTVLTDLTCPQTSKEGGDVQPKIPFETHPKNNMNKNCNAPFQQND